MIVNAGYGDGDGRPDDLQNPLGDGIRGCVRESDICGALGAASIGVILTEVEAQKLPDAKRAVEERTRESIEKLLSPQGARGMEITFRVYPESGGRDGAFDTMFFPEMTESGVGPAAELLVKRGIDLVGSVAGILLLAPAFLLLPIAVKLTSEGPVFFSQERFGLNGKRFRLLKFRTMHVGNQDDIHREFVKKLIQGQLGEDQGVYKITGDPRVTSIGRLLRKYSLDELPQLFNVLSGEMSLVGPRPPIAYEVEEYRAWQRNRLMGKKPGVTGAWQVSGRSSTNFDEMVRLDLRYLRGWSVALDLKIILQTPLAVLRCRGAY